MFRYPIRGFLGYFNLSLRKICRSEISLLLRQTSLKEIPLITPLCVCVCSGGDGVLTKNYLYDQ